MTWLLWTVLFIMEIGFAAYEFVGKSTKKEWTKRRMLVSISEKVVYLLMLLLPGIDFGFRFKGLWILLTIRILIALIVWLKNRGNDMPKKKAGIVLSAIGSLIIITLSMIPAFLFKDYNGRPTTGEYDVAQLSTILVDKSRVEEFETDGSNREVPAHFFFPEGIENMDGEKLPLVVFSHGAFGYYESNASTYLELASNGYVVVSLDHPYHAFYTKDTDGKTIIVNMDFFNSALTIGGSDDEFDEEYIYGYTSKWMKLRMDDTNFVLDTLIDSANKGEANEAVFYDEKDTDTLKAVLNHIDTDKIGLMGHSLGGATAVTVGRRDDVSAVIDFDGTMLGEELGVKDGEAVINEEPYTTPLLCFDSQNHHDGRVLYKQTGVLYANNVVMSNATEGFETYFKGAEHMDYTDLPLFAPGLAKMLGAGDINHEETIDKMNEITLNFFNCYLKDGAKFSVNESY